MMEQPITIQRLFKEGYLNKEQDAKLYEDLVKSIEQFNRYVSKQTKFSYNPPLLSRKIKRAVLTVSLIGVLGSALGGVSSSISNILKPKAQAVQVAKEETRKSGLKTEQEIQEEIKKQAQEIKEGLEYAKHGDYADKKEMDFRKVIVLGAEREIGKPVRFSYTNEGPPINVCIDIVVRAMQYAGIKIPYGENQRACSYVGSWMIRNGCTSYDLNSIRAKPGMMLFFSGYDTGPKGEKKFKEWMHSAIVATVDENGRVKTVIMSTKMTGFEKDNFGNLVRTPFSLNRAAVKVADISAWYRLTEQAGYHMRVRAVLDPYELLANR